MDTLGEYATVWVDDLPDLKRGEEIVRCRDCESYRERYNGCVEFGRMEYEEYAIVEPNGFCAWGKRREA